MNETGDVNNPLSDLSKGIPPYFLVVFAVLLWSTGGVFIKLTSLDAFSVNLGRSLLAAIAVGIFLAVKKQLVFKPYILIPAFFYALTLSTFVYANKNTTAANAIFLQYTAPIYILIFAPFVLKEKFRIADLATVVLCLAGMSLFFLDPGEAVAVPGANSRYGIIAGLIAGVCLGLYFLMLKHPRSRDFNPALSVFYGNIIIVLMMLPFVLSSLPAPDSQDLLALTFLGIFQIAIAYILFTYGIARGVRPLDASIIGFMEPILNPVWVLIVVGELPSTAAVTGGAVIISAIAFHTMMAGFLRRSKKPVP